MRPHFILIALALLSLATAAYVGPRLYTGNPVRSAYCKIVECDELDTYDTLCRAASIAEFGEYETIEARWSRVRAELEEEPFGKPARKKFDEALAAPRENRYAMLKESARASGAPGWDCPALDRTVTSTSP